MIEAAVVDEAAHKSAIAISSKRNVDELTTSIEAKNLMLLRFRRAQEMANVRAVKPNEEQTPEPSTSRVERIYLEWDEALSRNDAEALLQLYAPDAVIESPLIPHLLGKKEGICRGRDQMRPFFEAVAARKPPVRQYYRTGYLTDGKRLIFEYPRTAEQGEQMDFVESMEINDDGQIQRHCVYWGWYGFGVLQRNEYHR